MILNLSIIFSKLFRYIKFWKRKRELIIYIFFKCLVFGCSIFNVLFEDFYFGCVFKIVCLFVDV